MANAQGVQSMLKTALLFGDGAVLQRDKRIPIWGYAAPHAPVSISVQGQTARTTANEKGEWLAYCGPLRASRAEEVCIRSGDEQLRLRDVAVGEVWIAGGQSNMELPMRYDAALREELARCDGDIRFFDYPEVAYEGQLEEADYSQWYGHWMRCVPESLERFSAVGYHFARSLRKRYAGVPVGIVGCNWGGTPACAWMPEEAIRACGGEKWLEGYAEATAALDTEKYMADFRADARNYRTDQLADPLADILQIGYPTDVILQKVAELGLTDALQPVMGPFCERRPAGLYRSMVCQVAPYGARGVLWYQGEADDERAELYHRIFPALIRSWRDLWGEELPFLFVQLAPFERWMACRGDRYPEVRSAQQWVADNVPNTAMAVITDCGSRWDIHPKEKRPVGERLALLAARYVYGADVLCEAPRMKSAAVSDSRIDIRFDHAGDGLHLDGARLDGLELYQDGYPVGYDACAAEGDTLTVLGESIRADAPTQVRLAWTGYCKVGLKNSAGIPARPAILSANERRA